MNMTTEEKLDSLAEKYLPFDDEKETYCIGIYDKNNSLLLSRINVQDFFLFNYDIIHNHLLEYSCKFKDPNTMFSNTSILKIVKSTFEETLAVDITRGLKKLWQFFKLKKTKKMKII